MSNSRIMTDVAWAAGFCDGESNIRFQRCKRGYGRFVFDVAQVDPRPLQKLVGLFGGKVYGPYTPKTKNSSPYHRWVIAARMAKEALDVLYPYLIVKQEQADKAYALYEEYQKEPNQKPGPRKFSKKSYNDLRLGND